MMMMVEDERCEPKTLTVGVVMCQMAEEYWFRAHKVC